MEYGLLGASGLEVSVLSFGTMTLGGAGRFAAMGNVQTDEARRFVDICIEAGVSLFDTAGIYSFGKSEEVLGQALEGRGAKTLCSRPRHLSDWKRAPTSRGSRGVTWLRLARPACSDWEPTPSISTRRITSIR